MSKSLDLVGREVPVGKTVRQVGAVQPFTLIAPFAMEVHAIRCADPLQIIVRNGTHPSIEEVIDLGERVDLRSPTEKPL